MAISIAAASNAPSPAIGFGLIQKANGEYTAASVAANPVLSYGMIRQIDGGYIYPISSSINISPKAQAALYSLKPGG